MIDWRPKIVQLVKVKEALAHADKERLFPQHLPEVRASADRIQDVETQLGYALDDGYRSLLSYVDGWRAFLHGIDLMGTTDLVGGERQSHAQTVLEEMQAHGGLPDGLSSRDLVPIGVCLMEHDVVAMLREPPKGARSPVYWFGDGDVVGRYATFEEFFDTAIKMNRRLYEKFLGRHGGAS